MKSGAERELLTRYLDRAEASARAIGLGTIQTIEMDESRARAADQRRLEESTFLRAKLPAHATTILLDENGQNLGSEAFASLIARERDTGATTLAFVIGGPDGLERGWRDAQRTLAFGAATFPHQLVRVLLAEQVYRATTILAGHPYHRA